MLIIDDRGDFAAALAAMLAAEGYRAVLAGNGRDGLEVLRREVIGLVVTDIAMPEEDGFGVLRALAAAKHPVPAIVITGNARRWPFDLGRFAAMLGAAACLAKPFPPEQFLEAVRRLLPQRRGAELQAA